MSRGQSQSKGLLFGARIKNHDPLPPLLKKEFLTITKNMQGFPGSEFFNIEEVKQARTLVHQEGKQIVVSRPLDDFKAWFLDGQLHSSYELELPALEYGNIKIYGERGNMAKWTKNDHLHREDGPALKTIHADIWYQFGQKHREDGPALCYHMSDANEWWHRGQLHREDGPAITEKDGSWSWYSHGQIHRTDGPAQFLGQYKHFYYKQNGVLHREDGPAIEGGTIKEWYVQGERHREDGPAIDDNDQKAWYFRGKKHRLDGPAVVMRSEREEFFVNGKQCDKEDYDDCVREFEDAQANGWI